MYNVNIYAGGAAEKYSGYSQRKLALTARNTLF